MSLALILVRARVRCAGAMATFIAASRAKGYGFEGSTVDGTDLADCLKVIGSAVERARAGGPPQLVVASVLRLAGHGEHDDASYITDEIKLEPFAQDCLKCTEKVITDL